MITKFRAWLKEEKEMIPADLMEWDGGEFEGIGDRITFWKDADEIEIMQSTGLKDKNGVEIFEGDLIKIRGLNAFLTVVRDRSGLYKIVGANIFLGLRALIDWVESVEVISNIYENKELLEDEDTSNDI